MSIKSVQNNNLTNRSLLSAHSNQVLKAQGQPSASIPRASTTAWVRNPSWLTMPSVLSTDQKVVVLNRVDRDSNFASLIGYTSSGTYTVNWGDGVTETFASGVQCYHEYDFNNSALNNTNAPVTFTDSTDVVNRTAHGYTDGTTVSFYNLVSMTGIATGQLYYVVNSTANTFQFSDTLGGSPIAFTGNGSGTLLPYKQNIITITPTTANLIGCNLNVLHNKRNAYTLSTGTGSCGFLDIIMSVPNMSTASTAYLAIGSAQVNGSASNVYMAFLESVTILNLGSQNTISYLFSNCASLRNVVISASTSLITNTSFMFTGCNSLLSAPLFDTSNVTTMASMFVNCYSLTSVPLYNTSNVTDMSSMFSGCASLSSVPLLDMGKVTTLLSTFSGCSSLSSLPVFNLSNVTSMSSTFLTCYSLTSIPLFDTSKVTDMTNTFSGCRSITTVPLLNTASVTLLSGTFQNCVSLTSVPLLNTSSATTMFNMFNNCTMLTSVPLFNTANVTNMGGIFTNCYSMLTVPLFDMTNVLNCSSMFINCYSLTTVPLFNTANATSMGSMFATCYSLTTVPLLNTAKNVTFNNFFNTCNSLVSVPAFNTSSATDMSGMFQNCFSLKTVPMFDTSKVTTMASMFSSCFSLITVPLFNTSAVTTMASMFNNCPSLKFVPDFDTSSVTTFATMFSGATVAGTANIIDTPKLNMFGSGSSSLLSTTAGSGTANVNVYNIKASISLLAKKLSQNAINRVLSNLYQDYSGANPTLTLTNNYGVTNAVVRTANTTLGSNVVVMTNTALVNIGMSVTGSGLSYPVTNFTYSGTSNTFIKTAHGFSNNCKISLVRVDGFDTRSLPNIAAWSDVIYTNNKFIAVTSTGDISAVSYDQGLTWQYVSMGTNESTTSIAAGQGSDGIIRLIKTNAGTNTSIGYSNNYGNVWLSSAAASASIPWRDVAFGGGKFVAVPANTTNVYVSNNGISWVRRDTAQTLTSFGSTAYGDNTWVTLISGSNTVTSRDNTVTWSLDHTLTSISTNWSKITYGNGVFLAVSSNPQVVAVSYDRANTWLYRVYSPLAVQTTLAVNEVMYTDNIFIIATNTANYFTSSDKGNTWLIRPVPVTGNVTTGLRTIAFGGSNIMAISANTGNALILSLPTYDPSEPYYVKNKTQDTFQISETPGGAVFPMIGKNTAMTASARTGTDVVSIVTNTSITLSSPATSTQTLVSLSFRDNDLMLGLTKGWTITL